MPGMGGHFMNPMMQMGGQMYSQQFRGGRGSQRNGGNGGRDPRAVRSYVDLDAPAEGEPDFGF
ncbi:hypothetical protein EC988_004073 [Linderina pennispora]|nr:hypothetical protein EC988_004073 [Linderina pennispora]